MNYTIVRSRQANFKRSYGLNYGLGLINVSAQVILIILGLLLVLSVLVMNLRRR
jgi:predicted ABC-type sugar transport system permease subunit